MTWPTNYKKRKKITITRDMVASDLSNEIVYIPTSLLGINPASNSSVRFEDSKGYALTSERVVLGHPGNGTDHYVHVPEISSTEDTVIYVYYDTRVAPPSGSAPDPDDPGYVHNSIWDDDWDLVAHLDGYYESGDREIANNLLLTDAGAGTIAGVAGDIGGAAQLPSDASILVEDYDSYVAPSGYSLCVFFNYDGSSEGELHLLDRPLASSSTTPGLSLTVEDTGVIRFNVYATAGTSVTALSLASPSSTFTPGDSGYITVTVNYDGSNATIVMYLNGVEVASTTISTTETTADYDLLAGTVIGSASQSDSAEGLYSEVRQARSALSASQVAFQSATFTDPGDVFTIGDAEDYDSVRMLPPTPIIFGGVLQRGVNIIASYMVWDYNQGCFRTEDTGEHEIWLMGPEIDLLPWEDQPYAKYTPGMNGYYDGSFDGSAPGVFTTELPYPAGTELTSATLYGNTSVDGLKVIPVRYTFVPTAAEIALTSAIFDYSIVVGAIPAYSRMASDMAVLRSYVDETTRYIKKPDGSILTSHVITLGAGGEIIGVGG